ncbi:dehydrogenase [Parabacteroides sp. AM44-16]|nr:dehydrogenase [Parabacteroides sp. AM44-16]
MKTVVIIGAGQLGSRYLQSLSRSAYPLDIWTMDIDTASLETARRRYEEVSGKDRKNQVHYVQRMDMLPLYIDVAILSSTSKPRYSILYDLLNRAKVSYILLEKFLFPKMVEYDKAKTLLAEKQVKAWVNCGRRLLDYYHWIWENIDLTSSVQMTFKGKNWGLCCNSIHHIDAFMYLVREDTFAVDVSSLLPILLEGKRNGYIELYGELKVITPKGNKLFLTSLENYQGESIISIMNGNNTFTINEKEGVLYQNDEIVMEFRTPLQSELIGTAIDQILGSGTCNLSSYAESSSYHKLILTGLLPYINNLKGENSDFCPIT